MQSVRNRTIDFLQRYDLPAGPLALLDEISQYQSLPDICKRMIALFIYSMTADGLQQGVPSAEVKTRMLPIIEKFHAIHFFSAREQAFMSAETPTADEIFHAVWSYEALYALMGATGLIQTADIPSNMCEPALIDRIATFFIVEIGNEADLLGRIQIQDDVKDRLDRTTLLLWLARRQDWDQMHLPVKLILDVIWEWHKALNWLCYAEFANWDEVPDDA